MMVFGLLSCRVGRALSLKLYSLLKGFRIADDNGLRVWGLGVETPVLKNNYKHKYACISISISIYLSIYLSILIYIHTYMYGRFWGSGHRFHGHRAL